MSERHTACRCSTPLSVSLSLWLDAAAGTVLLRGDLGVVLLSLKCGISRVQ